MFIEKMEKNVLLKPLQMVTGIVERKQSLPILSNVLVQKSGSVFRFTATDTEIQISASLTDAKQKAPDNSITVAAKKFQDILRVLPEDSVVSLDLLDGRLSLKSGRSRFSLQTLPAQDYPTVTEAPDYEGKLSLPQNKFRKLLGMVQYAMAQQDIRYYLNGVLLVVEGQYLKLIATDGHRLAYASAELNGDHGKREVILPRKTVNELIKLLTDTEEEISIEIADNQVRMTFSGITLISRVIDGKFPDYTRVIPDHANKLVLDKSAIAQALHQVAILSNEKLRGVRFVLTEKNLSIISRNSEQEEAQEDMETDYHGDALDIGFNVNYLLDGLNSATTPTVMFSFGDSNSSILITTPGQDEYKYVVMPMRI